DSPDPLNSDVAVNGHIAPTEQREQRVVRRVRRGLVGRLTAEGNHRPKAARTHNRGWGYPYNRRPGQVLDPPPLTIVDGESAARVRQGPFAGGRCTLGGRPRARRCALGSGVATSWR